MKDKPHKLLHTQEMQPVNQLIEVSGHLGHSQYQLESTTGNSITQYREMKSLGNGAMLCAIYKFLRETH